MAYEVTFRPGAEDDLERLYTFIRDENGGPDRAIAYVRRIRDACMSLTTLPECGTLRDDIAPGLRILVIERRTLIAYRVLPKTVEIVAMVYGGRQLTHDLVDR